MQKDNEEITALTIITSNLLKKKKKKTWCEYGRKRDETGSLEAKLEKKNYTFATLPCKKIEGENAKKINRVCALLSLV